MKILTNKQYQLLKDIINKLEKDNNFLQRENESVYDTLKENSKYIEHILEKLDKKIIQIGELKRELGKVYSRLGGVTKAYNNLKRKYEKV